MSRSVAPRRRGLVVGCCHPHSPFALRAPEHDAVFYEKLFQKYGFEVRVLCDRKLGMESSTRTNIIRGIQWLVDDARSGDNLAFVFLGHGTATVGTSYERRDCLDRALCTALDAESGFISTSTLPFIEDTEFQALFSVVPAGALLTCIMDCSYGDTILKVPWYFNAKTETFSHVPQAIQHSQWPGDKYRHGEGARYLIRGVRPDDKVSNRSNVIRGPRELFPGVTAFLLCACRPDQVCFESTGIESQPQGIFSGCLAMALLQRMRGPCTYLELARCVQEQVQTYMCDNKLPGLAQDVLLGFNVEPRNAMFLQPPKESIVLQPNPLRQDLTSAVSGVLIGDSGMHRWPHVLLQLCRLGENTSELAESQSMDGLNQAILASEVVGECWLPSFDKLFPEISAVDGRLVGDQAGSVLFQGESYHSQHALACELKEPRLGSRMYHYTYAANAQSHSEHGSLFGKRSLPARSSIACFDNTLEWLNQGLSSKSEDVLLGARAEPVVGVNACVDELKDNIATVYGGNVRAFIRSADVTGRGEVNVTEFEWACKRHLGMDIKLARRAFDECLRLSSRTNESTLGAASLCLALQEREALTSQVHKASKDPMQVHVRLQWICGNTDAASLRIEDLEICQTPPLSATDYIANGVGNRYANSDCRGKPSTSWTRSHHGTSRLHGQESETPFFLRTCLCATRDDVPGVSDSQFIPSFMPHLVHVSTPLWNGARPDSGELYLRLPPSMHGVDTNSMVPICTMARLCELQKEAFSIRPDTLGKLTQNKGQVDSQELMQHQQQPLKCGPPLCTRELQAPELPRYVRPGRRMSDPDLTRSPRQ